VIDTVESFRLCPAPGCCVRVWGPTKTENRCKAHGGNELDLMEVVEDDPFGEPIRADGPDPLLPARSALPPEDCE